VYSVTWGLGAGCRAVGALRGITITTGDSCRSCCEVFELYAIPPRRRATHRLAAHATVFRPGGATNEACLEAWLQAEQALIRKIAFVAQCWWEAGPTEIFA
jgi:hypothetical protein